MKLVINKCFGGFGLSDEAYARLIELGIPTCPWDNEEYGLAICDAKHPKQRSRVPQGDRYYASWLRNDEHRSHPLLVQVVEELGDRANGFLAKLKVVEIPDGVSFEINDYDGMETVHEAHRSWA